MSQDVIALYHFQQQYLFQVLANIPDDVAYERGEEKLNGVGLNSAGWLMGHLCAEGIDVLTKLAIEYRVDVDYSALFSYQVKEMPAVERCPSLSQMKQDFDYIYGLLATAYAELDETKAQVAPPSELLQSVLSTTSAWFAHHLTTHLSIHIGNLTVWKKVMGIEVNGY